MITVRTSNIEKPNRLMPRLKHYLNQLGIFGQINFCSCRDCTDSETKETFLYGVPEEMKNVVKEELEIDGSFGRILFE